MKARFLLLLIPLLLFISLLIFLGAGLKRDPRLIPSPLIGKPVPVFTLRQLAEPDKIITHEALIGRVNLLNVWASWCVGCRAEHPFLMQLAASKVIPIVGFNYKDTRDNALRYLERHGNPYIVNAHDLSGRAGMDLGVYGAPETFLVDQNGKIIYKQVGPITTEIWEETFLPLIEQLHRRAGGDS